MALTLVALAALSSTVALFAETGTISDSEPGLPKGIEAPPPSPPPPPARPPVVERWTSLPWVTFGAHLEVSLYSPLEIQRALGAADLAVLPMYGVGVNAELRPLRYFTIVPQATLLLSVLAQFNNFDRTPRVEILTAGGFGVTGRLQLPVSEVVALYGGAGAAIYVAKIGAFDGVGPGLRFEAGVELTPSPEFPLIHVSGFFRYAPIDVQLGRRLDLTSGGVFADIGFDLL